MYNLNFITYLVDDCEIHGPLDSISGFPFETFLIGTLKSLIRSPNKVLVQMALRI